MLLTFPLMAAIQEISARVGRVTGHGIAGNVADIIRCGLLNVVVALLFIANTIISRLDLGAMAEPPSSCRGTACFMSLRSA